MDTSPAGMQAAESAPSEATIQTAPQAAPAQPQGGDVPVTSVAPEAPVYVPPPSGNPGDIQATQAQPMRSNLPSFKSGQQAESAPVPSRWDAWGANWDLMSHDSSVGLPGADMSGKYPRAAFSAWSDKYSQQNDVPMVSAAEANQRWPGRAEPYTGPVSPITAQMEFNDRQRVQALQQWVNRGSYGGQTAFEGLVAGMADPLNDAVMMLGDGLLGLGTKSLGLASRLGAEFAGNAATMGAINTGAAFAGKSLGENTINPGEIAKESAEQALGGMALHYGVVKPLGVVLKSAARLFEELPPDEQIKGIKENIANFDQNKSGDPLEEQKAVHEQRLEGLVQNGEKVEHPVEQVNPTEYWTAQSGDGKPAELTSGLGDGLQASSSKQAANNVAASAASEPGIIHKVELPENAKLLDLDNAPESTAEKSPEAAEAGSPESPEATAFVDALSKKLDIPPEVLSQDGVNLKDMIKNLGDWRGESGVPDDVLNQVQAAAKEAGYHGYAYTSPAGKEIHLFDPQQAKITPDSRADTNSTPQITPEQQTAIDEEKQQEATPPYATDRVLKQIHELTKGTSFDPDSSEAMADLKQIMDEAKQRLKTLADASPDDAAEMKSLQKEEARDKRLADTVKKVVDCATGDLT